MKDHLGNIRMTLTDDNTAAIPVLDAKSYYPFGLVQANISLLASGSLINKYQFGGKEIQNKEFSDGSGLEEYDFGARFLDHQLGVWHSIDLLAEKSRRWSPYSYTADNPIRFIDPDGMEYMGYGFDESMGDNRLVNYVTLENTTTHKTITIYEDEDADVSTSETKVGSSETNPFWASKGPFKVHQTANKNGILRDPSHKLQALDYTKIAGLNDATDWVDKDEHQTGKFSYMHAMWDIEIKDKKSIEQAKVDADKWVRTQFESAKKLLSEGKIYEAYLEFGKGLHTLQDATSPAHGGFQPWSNHPGALDLVNHVMQELFYPGLNSNLQNITNQYLNWFEHSNAPLPKQNLFSNIQADVPKSIYD